MNRNVAIHISNTPPPVLFLYFSSLSLSLPNSPSSSKSCSNFPLLHHFARCFSVILNSMQHNEIRMREQQHVIQASNSLLLALFLAFSFDTFEKNLFLQFLFGCCCCWTRNMLYRRVFSIKPHKTRFNSRLLQYPCHVYIGKRAQI